jgi:DnaJ domain
VANAVTLYDILGVLPGASTAEIQDAYKAKASQLAPGRISGASSRVVAAADRALRLLNEARRVLCDHDGRARYDEQAGISHKGTGLAPPEPIPDPEWDDGIDLGVDLVEDALGGLLDLLIPHPHPPRRVVVPDVRGVFASVCLDVVPRAGFRLETVRLTEHPMPVDGLVVDQSLKPGEKVHRFTTLTVHIWHPPAPPRPAAPRQRPLRDV